MNMKKKYCKKIFKLVLVFFENYVFKFHSF